MPPPYIAILEDNTDRRTVMQSCLQELLPTHTPIFFDSAHDMVTWLRTHQPEVSLISLDFDLPITRTPDGHLVDYGTGNVVADHLAATPPTCPVIIHSSNATGAFQMAETLRRAGWPTARVHPADDTAWIPGPWLDEIRSYVSRGFILMTD